MEDLQIFSDFSVESNVNGVYTVNFIKNLNYQLVELSNCKENIFIVDKNILKLFQEDFKGVLRNSNFIIIESSEKNKTIDYSQVVLRELIKINIRKDNKLIAVGGGITQDIVAFISTIIFRGVKWEFVPTTLLAQCDSCIGSKSSINFDQYKNLLGTFNPPSKIYIYNGFLDTLTESEIRSGIGEMLHYYLTVGLELAEQLMDQLSSILVNRNQLEYFIVNSLKIKKKIIELDEYDNSIRHIFNYGHTFGHAIETITNYKIPHGQAITIGMDLANYISLKLNFIDSKLFDRLHHILERNQPRFLFNENNIILYLNALSKDKKNKDSKIGCILLKKIGFVEKVFLNNDEWLRNTILDYSKNFNF